MSVGGFRSWTRERLCLGPTLCCPVRVMWRDYQAHCAEWGFPPCSAVDFVALLREEEGVELAERGHGRLRRVASGCGLLPIEGGARRTGTVG